MKTTALFAGAGSADGHTFVQTRTALFAMLMFWNICALLTGVNVMYALYPVTRPTHATAINIFAAAGLGLLAWAWWISSKRGPRSDRLLLGIDIASMAIMGPAFAASGIFADDQEINVYASYMWMSYVVFTRSMVLPSSARRTAVLSSVALFPMLVSAAIVEVEVPTIPLFAGTLIFCLVIVALATIGSHIVYGLRAQVTEAMQLGQYTVLDKIGEGGMGTVYMARHAMLRRPTAVKLLKPDRVTKVNLARFEREVQATSELAHPNTVAIYDYGRSPEGLFYYAMEFLDGLDLDTLIQKCGAQPWQRTVHILRQICGALEEAHDRGLVHRDIKPSNIVLCNRGGIPDFAKVVDFGLVKDLGRAERLTRGNVVTGTPAYLAPEAIMEPNRVGPASDLYALGALGYHLVTGTNVFSGTNVVEVCRHHVDTAPTPPSERTDNTIPVELEALLIQCLEKAPERRPQSATLLKRRLDAIAESGPWSEEQAAIWWSEFEAEHGEMTRPSSHSSLATMNVDFRSRTDVEAPCNTAS